MDIKIIKFTPDNKGAREGFVDFKIIYTPEKSETFRQVAYFEKGDKRWLSLGATEREGKWLPKYERTPSLNDTFHKVIHALDDYLNKRI